MGRYWAQPLNPPSTLVPTLLLLLFLSSFQIFVNSSTASSRGNRRIVNLLASSSDVHGAVWGALRSDRGEDTTDGDVVFVLRGLNVPSSNRERASVTIMEDITLRPTRAIGEDCTFTDEDEMIESAGSRDEFTRTIQPHNEILIPEDSGDSSINMLLSVTEEGVEGFLVDEDSNVFRIKQEKGSSPLRVIPVESFSPSDGWECTALHHDDNNGDEENRNLSAREEERNHDYDHSHGDSLRGHEHGHDGIHHHHEMSITSTSDFISELDRVKRSLRHRKRDANIGRRLYCELK